jgi:predicted nucleic acid-binding protein
VIYLDTSVALAHLLGETRRPADSLWQNPLIASRLLQYELWTRLNARGLGATHGEDAREVLASVALVELAPPVLARALEPFPAPVRTLDALHLATLLFVKGDGAGLRLATYDERLAEVAVKLGVTLWDG